MYTIKPLQWKQTEFQGKKIIGNHKPSSENVYIATIKNLGDYTISHEVKNGGREIVKWYFEQAFDDDDGIMNQHHCKSLEDAKKKCWEHWLIHIADIFIEDIEIDE